MIGSGRGQLHRFLPQGESRLRLDRSTSRITEGMRPIRESVGDLPIRVTQDEWTVVQHKGSDHIRREFKLSPVEMKMLICEIVDAQEDLGHTVNLEMDGDSLIVRSTTHEFGEPTERDREIARRIDAAYDEMRSIYK